jgi:hypothetical protein
MTGIYTHTHYKSDMNSVFKWDKAALERPCNVVNLKSILYTSSDNFGNRSNLD